MGWKRYAVALLVFNTVGALFVYAVQRLQAWLPLNPAGACPMSARTRRSIRRSASSANTNWQGYGGESTMSYLTQMLALTVQNFLSAATGMAVVVCADPRLQFAARRKSIGNFWVDVTRSTLYVLLPLSVVFAVFLMGQGVIQNFSAYKDVTLLDPVTYSQPEKRAGRPAAEGRQAATR